MTDITRRDMARGGLALSALMMAPRVLAQTGARATPRAALDAVDPELRPVAERMIGMGGGEPMTDAKLAATREGLKAYMPKPLATVPVQRRSIKHLRGGPDVTVYVINAKPGTRRPAIVHTHGGGYFSGSAEANVRYLQDTATAVDCVIVTVEYRLAPETRFDGSLEDNYSALRWVHDQAAALGVDPRRIAVMGESAGGGHAALLAQAARDRGEVPLVFQCLIYPMLDDRIGSVRQLPDTVGQILWTAESNRYGWRSFLGRTPGGAATRGVPARVASVAGLPPAFIGVGAIDLFVIEDIAYATRLIEGGIATEMLVVPGAFHGFDILAADSRAAKMFTIAKNAALQRALHG